MILQVELTEEQIDEIARRVAQINGASNKPKSYTPAEFAAAMGGGLKEKTVRRRIAAGIIRTIPNMGRIIIPASELERLTGGDASR